MKVPSVSLQPERSSGYSAGEIVPRQNTAAQTAERLGGALESAGLTALRVDEILQQRVDVARAKEADAKIADSFRELLTSPNGYRNKVGRGAIDGRQDVIKALDENRRQILDTLTPAQRALVADSDETRYQHARGVIDGHYTQQIEAYEVAENEARANTLMQDAVDAFFAPESPIDDGVQDPQAPGAPVKPRSAFDENRAGMRQELIELAQRKGLGPEATRALLAKADDNLHAGVVTRLIEQGRATEAKSYLEQHQEQITAGVRTRLSDGLELAVTKEQGARVAQRLSTLPGGSAAQFAKLQELYDTDKLGSRKDVVFKEALQQLTQHDRLVSEERNRQRADVWSRVEQYAQLHGGALDAAHQQLLTDTGQEDRFALWTMQGKQFITTDTGHYALTVLTGRQLRERFSSEQALRESYRFELTTPDLDHLTARWRDGLADMPKLDKAIVLADGLREALGLPKNGKQAQLDKDLFDRWANSVNVEVRRLMAAKPGSTEEEHWSAAIEAAKTRGFFLDEAGAQRRLFVQAEPSEWRNENGVFVRLPSGRMLQAALELVDPVVGGTYRQTVQTLWATQVEQELPGKPYGSVMIGGRAVPFAELTDNDLLTEAALLREQREKVVVVERQRNGREWLRAAYDEEFRKATDSRSADSRPASLRQLQEQAQAAVLDRRDEWAGFGLPANDVDAVLGITQESRAQKAFDYLLRFNDTPEKVGASLTNINNSQDWLYDHFGLDAKGIARLGVLAGGVTPLPRVKK